MKEEVKHNLVMISGTFLHSTLFFSLKFEQITTKMLKRKFLRSFKL